MNWIIRVEAKGKDTNLRPSAPKALKSPNAELGFQTMSIFC